MFGYNFTMMAPLKASFLFALFWVIKFCHVSADTASYLKPYFSQFGDPGPTPSPINITSNNTVHVDTPFPRFVFVTTDSIDEIINNGHEIFIAAPSNTGTFTTGGVSGTELYKFIGDRLIWNNKFGPAASVVDGVGTPLEFINLYVKAEYGTLNKAKHYRDGMVIASTRIKVEPGTNNTGFTKFASYIEKIKKAYTNVTIPQEIVSGWLGVGELNEYYAYLGSFTDFVTKNQYYCATIIVNSISSSPSISPEQFRIFSKILNQKGKPYDNPLTAADTDGRRVVNASPTVVISTSEF